MPHLLRLIALVLLATLVPAAGALAQADEAVITVTESDPRANAVLADPPAEIALTFSAAIDPEASAVRLLGENGEAVAGAEARFDGATATITLPELLPTGSWLVAWDVAASDGARGSGFHGFTVGLGEDIAPLTIPDTGFAAATATRWLVALAQGLALLGALLLASLWPLRWLATRDAGAAHLLTRMPAVAAAGMALTVTGAVTRLVAEGWGHADGTGAGIRAAITDGDTGVMLLAMVALASVHTLALLADLPRWRDALPGLTTVALLVALALLTHADQEPAGRLPALAAAWLVLAALAVVAAGPIAMVVGASVPRWYPLAAGIALPILALGGAYLLWLFVGSRAAAEATTYGTIAIVSVALAGALGIALAGALLLARGTPGPRALAMPALLGAALAVTVGGLTTLEPARAEVTRAARQVTVPLALDETRAQIILAPGAAGVNHIRLELDREEVPRGTEASLTLAMPARADLGTATMPLARVSDRAFEYHGTAMALAGTWDLTVAVAEPGRAEATTTVALELPAEPPVDATPGPPWRFTTLAGVAGVVLVAAGIAGIAAGVVAGSATARRESAGLGLAALALAAVLLVQGRLDPILAQDRDAIDPDDIAMVTRGEAIYAEACLACHGPELRGDGPAAAGMAPPAADFSAPHTRVHDEATLIYWVRNGKQGTAMPAFGDRLSDQEIAAVLSYIAREQREMGGATPVP